MTTSLKQYRPSAPCSCPTCKGMCKRPCWPTPQEADKLLDANLLDSLMLDAWIGGFSNDRIGDVYIVCPANPGHGGYWAPGLGSSGFDWFGDGLQAGCVMQDKKGLCKLHDKGLKPIEGRVASCKKSCDNLHEAVARTWDSDEGRRVVARFCELTGLSL